MFNKTEVIIKMGLIEATVNRCTIDLFYNDIYDTIFLEFYWFVSNMQVLHKLPQHINPIKYFDTKTEVK